MLLKVDDYSKMMPLWLFTNLIEWGKLWALKPAESGFTLWAYVKKVVRLNCGSKCGYPTSYQITALFQYIVISI